MRASLFQQSAELFTTLLPPPEPPEIPGEYPPIGGVWTKDDTIRLILQKADEYNCVRWEILGGMIAEGLNVYASRPVSQSDWRRYWEPPAPTLDVSFGLGQASVRYTAEYEAWCKAHGVNFHGSEADRYPGDHAIEEVRRAYFNPYHALDVAIPRYKYWRYNPEVPAVQAWVGYNGPSFFHTPEQSPNYGHYRDSLQEARRILGVESPISKDRIYIDDVPDVVIRQQNNWSCAVRTTYGMLWMAAQKGLIEPVTYGDGGPRDVYDLMVPRYDTPDVGLHDHTGAGIVKALAEWGIRSSWQYPASLRDVQAIAGQVPAGIGGRRWSHWSCVRGVEADGTLILENPMPGFAGIHHQLRDSFGRLGDDNGMMSLVWLNV